MKPVALVFSGLFVLFVVSSQSGCHNSLFIRPPVVRVSDPSIDTAEPAIAADSNGNIYVAYVEHSEDKTANLYVHKYTSSLDQAGPSVQVNPVKASVKAWTGDAPTIQIAPDQSVLVGWTLRAGGGTHYVLSVSRDGGTTFSAPTKINDDEALVSHGMHSLAVGSDGTIYAAWLDERNIGEPRAVTAHAHPSGNSDYQFVKVDQKGPESSRGAEPNSEVFFALSKDGGKSFSKNRKLASDVCPCCKTAVTSDESGRVYVSWRQVLEGDLRHIAVAASADGGNSFLPPSIVSNDRWQITACPVSGAAIDATMSDLSVLWYTAGSEGQPGYYIARSTDGGAKFSPRIFIGHDAASGTPALLRTKSGTTVVYQGEDDRVVVASATDPTNFATRSTIDAANNPSAVSANGATYIVFVRTENKMRSVLIAKQ